MAKIRPTNNVNHVYTVSKVRNEPDIFFHLDQRVTLIFKDEKLGVRTNKLLIGCTADNGLCGQVSGHSKYFNKMPKIPISAID